MFRLYDGRDKLYQWDVNRKLIVDDNDIKEVHFANCLCVQAQVCETYQEGELTIVDIPNNLLQEYSDIRVYGYDGEATKHGAVFEVERRTKPADYVYTETEVKRYEDLEERIEALEEGGYATVEYVDEQRDNMYNELQHEVGYLQNEIDTRTPNYDNLTTYYNSDLDYGTQTIELLAFINGELAIYAKPAVVFYLIDSDLYVYKCHADKGMMFYDWVYSDYNHWGFYVDYEYDENGDIVDSTEYVFDTYGKPILLDIYSELYDGEVYLSAAIKSGGGSGEADDDSRNDIMFVMEGDTSGTRVIYKAKEGMTWEEWGNSEYTGGMWSYGYYDWPAYDCLYSNSGMGYMDANATDVIENGVLYTVCEGTDIHYGNEAMPAISFGVDIDTDGEYETFYAVDGMTWDEWVNTPLNTVGFYFDEERDSEYFLFYDNDYGIYISRYDAIQPDSQIDLSSW